MKFEFVLMNLYTIVSFHKNDSSSDKVSSLAVVATGVSKSNGDEALDEDDGDYEDYEDYEDYDNDDDGDIKEEENESTSNKTDDWSM